MLTEVQQAHIDEYLEDVETAFKYMKQSYDQADANVSEFSSITNDGELYTNGLNKVTSDSINETKRLMESLKDFVTYVPVSDFMSDTEYHKIVKYVTDKYRIKDYENRIKQLEQTYEESRELFKQNRKQSGTNVFDHIKKRLDK